MTKGQKRHHNKVINIYNKRLKLETLETLIAWHEGQPTPDVECIKDMRRRAQEIRQQLTVTSTIV